MDFKKKSYFGKAEMKSYILTPNPEDEIKSSEVSDLCRRHSTLPPPGADECGVQQKTHGTPSTPQICAWGEMCHLFPLLFLKMALQVSSVVFSFPCLNKVNVEPNASVDWAHKCVLLRMIRKCDEVRGVRIVSTSSQPFLNSSECMHRLRWPDQSPFLHEISLGLFPD